MRFSKYFKFLAIAAIVLGVTVFRLWSFPAESCSYEAQSYRGLELSKLENLLESTGLIGHIHGIGENNLFVLSVRDPDNFFSHRELALLPNSEPVREDLSQLHRHDQVCIQGKVLENPSAQVHVQTQSVTLLDAWEGLDQLANDIPIPVTSDRLDRKPSSDRLVGKVHAIAEDSKILVIESGNSVFPVFVDSDSAQSTATQDLYRGDIVRLAYRVQERPAQPPHLNLDPSVSQPLEVLDSIKTLHQTTQTLTGKLVKFPQSPQLQFDIYALAVETPVSNPTENAPIERIFTLVNFENMDNFMAIQDTLRQIWEASIDTAQEARNWLVNPEVTLQATGTVNVTSPEQANPQLVLDSVADLQVL